MLDTLKARLVDDWSSSWRWFTTWLNLFGSAAVTWALAQDSVVSTVLPFLPGSLKPYAPLLGILWGLFVQAARTYRQKAPVCPPGPSA